MNGAHCMISDEEYLPLPKQLQPTPVGRWTGFSPDTGTVGDPALQLTPDKGSRLLQEPAQNRNFAQAIRPTRDRTKDRSNNEPSMVCGRADFFPYTETIGDPLLQLTPDKGSRRLQEPAQNSNAVQIVRTSKTKITEDRTSNNENLSKGGRNGPRESQCSNSLGSAQSLNGGNLGKIDDGALYSHNTQKQGDRQKNKNQETVAWVEKHGDVRTIYNAGIPIEDDVRVKNVSSGQQQAKCHREKKVRRSLESRGDFEGSVQSNGIREQSRVSKEKERTKLKPILHKKGEGRDRAKSNSKKHVTLVVDTLPGLDRPRINSTSVLAARLQELEDETFDGESAVRRNLSESGDARTTLGGRAAGGANVPKNVTKYQGLVSVDIPSQAVLDQAVEERLMKLRVLAPDDEKPKKDLPPSPDVLDVFTPDMIVEYPNLEVSHVTLPPPRLEKVTTDEVFHLYRRISGWEK